MSHSENKAGRCCGMPWNRMERLLDLSSSADLEWRIRKESRNAWGLRMERSIVGRLLDLD